MKKRRNWTREELILAFNLYCKIPFGTLHSRNPRIIELSDLIGRSSSAVALKLTNFASFDPFLQKRGIKGMKNAGKMDKQIWDEFTNDWDNLIFESEKLLAKYRGNKDIVIDKKTFSFNDLDGNDKYRTAKARINQKFFRQMVLNIYNFQCAMCSLNIPELLIAGHIIPWSMNKKERLNPANGVCLCALHDKAFDIGLIGIDEDYKVVLSSKLDKMKNELYFPSYFGNFRDKPINLPDKFLPHKDFLLFHLKLHKIGSDLFKPSYV
ncbi:HNH endonuclease [Desulfobacterales bacterium HSG16]|nr:HNH endonuclease [Desulfobacterales bacterium HSG16]